jgi:hypothetical protein
LFTGGIGGIFFGLDQLKIGKLTKTSPTLFQTGDLQKEMRNGGCNKKQMVLL